MIFVVPLSCSARLPLRHVPLRLKPFRSDGCVGRELETIAHALVCFVAGRLAVEHGSRRHRTRHRHHRYPQVDSLSTGWPDDLASGPLPQQMSISLPSLEAQSFRPQQKRGKFARVFGLATLNYGWLNLLGGSFSLVP